MTLLKGNTMKALKVVFAVCFAGSFAAGFLACDKADEIFDCQSVCSRYQDCYDKNYDVSKCRSSCRDNSDRDSNFRQKADSCEKCISDKSCAGTFGCVTECAGVVP
jgi:hypothetical protein